MCDIGLHEAVYAAELIEMPEFVWNLLRTPSRPRRVYVIGGGLSGLACGVKLTEKQVPVTLYEASAQAGGRCRAYQDKQLNTVLDNGNHLILRGNKAAMRYIFKLRSFGEFYALAADYVMHDTQQKRQWLVRPPMVKDAWRLWRVLLAFGKQTVAGCVNVKHPFYAEFVEPLCIAALNTHPQQASATMLRNVLLRMAIPTMADYLQIRSDFNRALIDPAIAKIGDVRIATRLKGIAVRNKTATHLHFANEVVELHPEDQVVLALPPEQVKVILPQLELPEFEHNAIINGHFLVDTSNLAPRLLGATHSPLHWVFLKDGVISTTTSHAEMTPLWGKENSAEILWQELGKCYPQLADKPMPPHRIVTEKRATIAATPQNLAKRPKAETGLSNIRLAGDWLNSPLPACIEAAISSGEKAASWCLANTAK